MTQPALFAAESICVDYGARRVVCDVSFQIAAGGALGIVGESGAGKSSLLKALAGLGPAAEGRLLWKGADITRLSPRQRRRAGVRIGLVFQDPYASLNPRLPVWEIVAEELMLSGQTSRSALQAEASRALTNVGLPTDVIHHRPVALSGGQRQRVAIARALMGAPEVLLLDEPTSALDVTVQAQILAVLRDLRARVGVALITISHDLHVVRGLCDDVMVLRGGEVVEAGPAASVFSSPEAAYTRELLEATPWLGHPASPRAST
jgi:ABC-type glutathione transport system ATPase component